MTLQFKVPNMACAACGETIVKAVHAVDPMATVQANSTTKVVVVETRASTAAVKQAIAEAGYTVIE